jgi:4-hydroxy-2-oxoheptanedioate aldolase
MQIRNPARERLEKGELALGVGLRAVRTVDIAKMMKTCGYDWIFIDLEHGPFSIETATSLCVAALDTGISPIVRVPFMQHAMATRVLDGGALGIVMPHVDTADEARAVVDHLKYPPQGHRSLAGGQAIADFRPVRTGEFAAAANRALLTVVMLETPAAIENAAAIAAVPGVDALLIGTNDLAAEMGIPGEFGHARIVAACESVIAACRGANKWAGIGGVYTGDLLGRYVGMGVKLVLAGGDSGFLMEAAGARAALVRGWQ